MEGDRLEGFASNLSDCKTFREIFWKVLPDYMSFGMTPDEFWHGDPRLCEAYRRAYDLKRETEFYAELRQGRYVLEALLAASPAFREISRGINHESPSEPLFSLVGRSEEVSERQEKQAMEKNIATFTAFMVAHNLKRQQEASQHE